MKKIKLKGDNFIKMMRKISQSYINVPNCIKIMRKLSQSYSNVPNDMKFLFGNYIYTQKMY